MKIVGMLKMTVERNGGRKVTQGPRMVMKTTYRAIFHYDRVFYPPENGQYNYEGAGDSILRNRNEKGLNGSLSARSKASISFIA